MDSFIPQMIDAISMRRSHRHYLYQPLLEEHRLALERFIAQVEIPFEHDVLATLHVVPLGQNAVYFKGPREFIVFRSSESLVDQAKLGFLGEEIVLYAESLGVKTCWMGHYDKKVVQGILQENASPGNERHPFCIVTVGYIPEKTGFMDRYSQKRMSKKTRSVESFLHPESKTDIPEGIRFALERASRAPSAMNSQKWYYLVDKTSEGHVVELSKPAGYQHFKWHHYDIDVGTAASHLWLALKYKALLPRVTVAERANAAVWRFTIPNVE